MNLALNLLFATLIRFFILFHHLSTVLFHLRGAPLTLLLGVVAASRASPFHPRQTTPWAGRLPCSSVPRFHPGARWRGALQRRTDRQEVVPAIDIPFDLVPFRLGGKRLAMYRCFLASSSSRRRSTACSAGLSCRWLGLKMFASSSHMFFACTSLTVVAKRCGCLLWPSSPPKSRLCRPT